MPMIICFSFEFLCMSLSVSFFDHFWRLWLFGFCLLLFACLWCLQFSVTLDGDDSLCFVCFCSNVFDGFVGATCGDDDSFLFAWFCLHVLDCFIVDFFLWWWFFFGLFLDCAPLVFYFLFLFSGGVDHVFFVRFCVDVFDCFICWWLLMMVILWILSDYVRMPLVVLLFRLHPMMMILWCLFVFCLYVFDFLIVGLFFDRICL